MGAKVGHYEVLDEFASGGMASVHFGRLVRPGGFVKTVVIKRLRAELARDPMFVAMLLHEARVTGVVEHPNVVSTLDVVSSDADVFIVMEYVRGDSLANVLATLRERGEAMPPRIATALLGGVLHGLQAAHEATDASGRHLGIVHRDVSPQNVLVGIDGIARIADFGVAKSAAGDHKREPAGHVVGKLAYLAPEVVRGESANVQTDVYSTGIVLWEALTGRRLFTGRGKREVLDAVLTYAPPPPSRTSPEVPAELDEVTLRALERSQARRFASAREMAVTLEAACPPALPSEIASWIAPLVAPAVDRHGAVFAAIKDREPMLTFAATEPGAAIAPLPARAGAGAERRSRLAALRVPAVGGIVAVALGAGVALGMRAQRVPQGAASVASAEVAAEIARLQPEAAGVAAPSLAEPSPAAPSTSSHAPRTVRHRTPHPASGPAAAASVDCTKKFTIDGDGHTIFRKECL